MQITDVRLRKVNSENRMKAVASVTFDNEFVIHDIKVIESQNGLFIAMPSRKTPKGEWKDIAHPINSETRERIQEGKVYPSIHGGKNLTYDYAANAGARPNGATNNQTGKAKNRPYKKSEIKYPSKLFGFLDAEVGQLAYNNKGKPYQTSRHGKSGAGTVGFVDGHVEQFSDIPFTYGTILKVEDKTYYNWNTGIDSTIK